MTRRTTSRIAGVTFVAYIAVGIASLALSSRAMAGSGIQAKFATIAQHETELRVAVLLSMVTCFSALVLGVTLYALTRDEDRDIALLGLICRVAEGLAGLFLPRTLALLWLATSGPNAPAGPDAEALGAFLLRSGVWSPSAVFFAAGSTAFAWLLMRGRLIPIALAWLGVGASVLLLAVLPLQLAGFAGGPGNWASQITWLMWLPMLVYELALAAWLIVRGVNPAGVREQARTT
jgi:uncharacterized protein DUF4386